MDRERLTRDERRELDDLMYEAGCDEHGKPRPSHEIGPRVVKMLREAASQAQRHWAGYLLDDLIDDGALKRWKKWNSARVVVEVVGKTYTTTKAASMSVRKQDTAGRHYFQATLWTDMTRKELQQVVARAAKQVESERQTIAAAVRLLDLIESVPGARTVADALAAKETTLDGFLGLPEAA